MAWKCDDCGKTFDEPIEYDEDDVNYHALLCPYCRADSLIELFECKFCGELVPRHELTSDGYCDACVKSAARKFDLLLKSKFEKEELEIFEHEFGIEPINY